MSLRLGGLTSLFAGLWSRGARVALIPVALLIANVGGGIPAAVAASSSDLLNCPVTSSTSSPSTAATNGAGGAPSVSSASRTAQTSIRPNAKQFPGTPDADEHACIVDYPATVGAPTNLIGLTRGPDDNLWFVQREDDSQVWRMLTHAPYTLTAFPTPTQDSYLTGIIAGREGDLWFTEQGGFNEVGGAQGKIGHISAFGPNTVTEIAVPSAQPRPSDLTFGPDGNLWFTEYCSPGQPTARSGAPTRSPAWNPIRRTRSPSFRAHPVRRAIGDQARARRQPVVCRDLCQQARTHSPLPALHDHRVPAAGR